MTLQQYLLIFWGRRRLIFVVYVLTVVLALAVSLATPKTYSASVSMLVDIKNDPVSGTVLPDMTSLTYMANQSEIVQSDRVANNVIALLAPEHRQSIIDLWEKHARDKVSFDIFAADWLKRRLKVRISPTNNLMILSFSAATPSLAADGANAYSRAYVETAIDLRVEPARQSATWFDEQLNNQRTALKNAQNKLSAYQKEKGILAAGERHDEESTRLTALTGKLTEIQERRISGGSQRDAAAGQGSSMVQEIRTELFKAQTKLSQMNAKADVNYPPRKTLEAEIATLKQQLDAEVRRVAGTANPTNPRVTVQQESALNALIASQQNKVLSQLSERDEMALMVKDVETAQHAYDALAQRVSQIGLESKSQHANVSVLSSAQQPTEASRPKTLINFLIAHPGGLLLGLLLAMALEFMDRRVRSAQDLSLAENLPLLGVLKSEPPYVGLHELLSNSIPFPRALPFKRTEQS